MVARLIVCSSWAAGMTRSSCTSSAADRLLMDDFVGIEHDQAPDEIFELAHIARPGVPLQPLDWRPAPAASAAARRLSALRRKWRTRSGMSSMRSRNGGSRMGTTLRR